MHAGVSHPTGPQALQTKARGALLATTWCGGGRGQASDRVMTAAACQPVSREQAAARPSSTSA
eukprot:15473380-Alexandrium_andersonii.AAC.1